MKSLLISGALASVAFLSSFAPALAADTIHDPWRGRIIDYRSTQGSIGDDDLRISVGAGYFNVRANEYVYFEGSTISRLIWDVTSAAAIEARAEYDLTPRWTVFGSATVGIHHDAFMADYDWSWDPGSGEWTDRSRHPDTRLDHYFAFDVGASYAVWRRQGLALKLLGGARCTDLKMTAYGGDFVYSSEDGFRDYVGVSPDGERVITYQQRFPVLYGGVGTSAKLGVISFDAEVLGGVTVRAGDRDKHWQRSILFQEDFHSSPYLGLQFRASAPVSRAGDAFLFARYENHFKMKGDIRALDHSTGDSAYAEDAAGASLRTLTLGLGARIRF
ncbi:omptin family outer membrane protease [Chelativorans xinjiangense]|uniref:omptin family outer membrane protease n=1 Tax=Chelativorans xinjiangense TaxID=2681485 RepID=UPI001358C26A|nr:omptin family outer membrane protease [Chelativorans xinjiangense]